jgi:hypothetical protein
MKISKSWTKKVFYICHRCQYPKTFLSVIYKKNYSKLECCPWQAFPALSNKRSSLVPKFVNCRQKSFITLDQGIKIIKLFFNYSKLEHFYLESVNSLVFLSKDKSLLSSAPLLGKLLTPPSSTHTKIRSGLKKNTQAYLSGAAVTMRKV